MQTLAQIPDVKPIPETDISNKQNDAQIWIYCGKLFHLFNLVCQGVCGLVNAVRDHDIAPNFYPA